MDIYILKEQFFWNGKILLREHFDKKFTFKIRMENIQKVSTHLVFDVVRCVQSELFLHRFFKVVLFLKSLKLVKEANYLSDFRDRNSNLVRKATLISVYANVSREMKSCDTKRP